MTSRHIKGGVMDLNTFLKWQAEDVLNRDVAIKIRSDFDGKQQVVIFVYDLTYSTNQVVSSVEEIDFPGVIRRRDAADLKRLQKKYPVGVE